MSSELDELRASLRHVVWIGGAPDAGKTTVARLLAERRGLAVYRYDQHDGEHHAWLAMNDSTYRDFVASTMEERWIHPTPDQLLARAMISFFDRAPLMLEDVTGMPADRGIVAEGFGLTPEIIAPLLESERQAIWFVPTEDFKRAAMERRDKPEFSHLVSDPDRGRENLLARDRLMAGNLLQQARRFRYRVVEVDGTCSPEELTALVERHFAPFLPPQSQGPVTAR